MTDDQFNEWIATELPDLSQTLLKSMMEQSL